MADPRVQTRIPQTLHDWLEERSDRMYTGGVGFQVREELGIWYMALTAELRRIRLTLNQANCLADILNSTPITSGIAGSAPLVFFEASDAFHLVRSAPIVADEATYGEKWGIDEQALLTYLQGLGPTADHALHDAVNRWWKAGCEPTVEGWAAVGLTVLPDPDPDSAVGGEAT